MGKERIFAIGASILLALMAVLAGGAALRESVTFDELAHVGAGVSYWQKLDLRHNPEHPPLAKALAALPLVIRGTRADYSSPQWTLSQDPTSSFMGQWVFGEWLLFRWNDSVSTLAWARFPMLLLTLALGWVMYRMGRRLGGPWGGLLSVALYVSTPAFIAFGPLVHTDLAITLFTLLAIWSFADLCSEPTRRRVWIFAACLAGALLSKFTAVLLLLIFPVMLVSSRWLPVAGQPAGKEEQRAWRKLRWRAAFRGVLLAGGMVYAVYMIFSWNQPTWVLDHIPGGPALAPIRRLLMPVWEYVLGLLIVIGMGSRQTFILGQSYPHGVWFYYPVLLALKSTLGFLVVVALGAGVGLAVRRKFVPSAAFHWRATWVSLIVLAGVCVAGGISISIRHFSVPLALMILMLAPLPAALARLRTEAPRLGRALQALTAGAAASSIVSVALAYPYYFPYMNRLTRAQPAYTLANDSNVDWNQSLPEARRFAESRGIKDLAVDAYGLTDPAHSIPGARLWDCQTPTDRERGQWVVVSANMILDAHNCGWIERYPREEIGGGSMYAFRLPEAIPTAGSPGGPPLPSQHKQIGGIPVEFDVRAQTIELTNHPERMSAAIEQIRVRFEQEREKAKRASQDRP
jgi:4-amino-4-deoxy-L-arabinose transferase-like glycosyltransferase